MFILGAVQDRWLRACLINRGVLRGGCNRFHEEACMALAPLCNRRPGQLYNTWSRRVTTVSSQVSSLLLKTELERLIGLTTGAQSQDNIARGAVSRYYTRFPTHRFYRSSARVLPARYIKTTCLCSPNAARHWLTLRL